MSIGFVSTSQSASACLSAVGPLGAVAADNSEAVHLARLHRHGSASVSLCAQAVTGHAPRRLLHLAGCQQCVDLALAGGATFAQDRHGALVNLRRLGTTENR